MPCIYVFSDERFSDRIKLGRCRDQNAKDCIEKAWCYTPGIMKNIAVWSGSDEQIKVDEAHLKRHLSQKEVRKRFPSAGREVYFVPVADAVRVLSDLLGREPDGEPYNFLVRPEWDNLRDPPARLLSSPAHRGFRQTAWVFREQDIVKGGPQRIKVSRLKDARTPAEQNKRYSFAGLETISGWTYPDTVVSLDQNIRVEESIQYMLRQFGDTSDACMHGWLRSGVTVENIEEAFRDVFRFARCLPGELTPGTKPAYNRSLANA